MVINLRYICIAENVVKFLEDIVLLAVDYARRIGAEYAEARYHKISSEELFSRNGDILGVGKGFEEGIGIRVIVNGALGFTSINKLDRDSIIGAVEKIVYQTRALSRCMKEKIVFSEARVGRSKYSVVAKKPFHTVSFDDKVKLHRELWSIVSRAKIESKISVFILRYSESIEEKIVVNSDGAFIHSITPRLSVMYNIVINHPEKGTMQKWEQLGASGGLEWLDDWRIHERVDEIATSMDNVLVKGKSPPRETIDVVVGSEIVGLIVHESCGHPSEADRILGREAAQAGKSFIKKGMIGERIGSEYATVIDDPTIPGSYGFYLYDDEGVPAKPRYLYRNGLINEHLHNRWTAYVYGVESNASARAMDYRSEPIVRMANTYFKPGDYSFDELLEDVKLGIYMKSFMEWNIDDERWSQRYVGLEAYLIEKGELKEPVKYPVLEITTKSFYSNVDAADKDLKFYAGTCGKGEPMQGVPVWMGGPNVRLRNIRIGVVE